MINVAAQTSNTLPKGINCGINPHAPPCCLPPTDDPSCLKMPSMYGSFISGSSEVPPVNTNATGLAFLTHYQVSDPIQDVMRDIVRYDINLDGLTSIFVHIHQGKIGENGSIVATLYTVGTVPCCLPAEIRENELEGPLEGKPVSALVDLMNSGNAYVNVHTVPFPDGEIRGQINPIIFTLPTVTENSSNTTK